jgi:hypothetical protein
MHSGGVEVPADYRTSRDSPELSSGQGVSCRLVWQMGLLLQDDEESFAEEAR